MLKAGFDYSWTEASFACMDFTGALLLEEHIAPPPRNASNLPCWMEQCLASRGRSMEDISEWSVGSGPGSFTGLRLASAFVMGRAFARENVLRRAVPTAAAMAHGAKCAGKSGKNAGVLFDGRRDELLLYGMTEKEGSFVPSGVHAVLSSQDLSPLGSFDFFAALERDREVIEKVAGSLLAGKVVFLPHIQASYLILNEPGDFSRPLTDLVYLRPAVFVEPKIPRNL